jgi:hypothetical protein
VTVAAEIAMSGASSASRFAALALPVQTLIGWFFSSLTVILTERELIWFFGPGQWTYRLPSRQISAVKGCQEQFGGMAG